MNGAADEDPEQVDAAERELDFRAERGYRPAA
jgi:hypothetical protein